MRTLAGEYSFAAVGILVGAPGQVEVGKSRPAIRRDHSCLEHRKLNEWRAN